MTYKSNNTNKINFKKLYIKANEILVSSQVIQCFPFKVSGFLKEQADIKLCTFSKAIKKYNIDITIFGSESAVLMEYCGANIIFYNQNEPDYRIRFSIIHEFAHYILGHEKNLNKDDPKYIRQEIEANVFAAQILMPEQILREISRRGKRITQPLIKNCFTVSDDAADKKVNTLAKTVYDWRSREEKTFDDIILSRYMYIVDGIAPLRYDRDFYLEDEFDRQRERDSWGY